MFFDKKKGMSESAKKAKLAALHGAKSMAEEALKGNLGDAKQKVVVSADSKEGLKKGLDLAEDVLEKGPELGEKRAYDSADSEKDEQEEGFEDQQEESEPMDEAEIDEEIQRLLELKAKLENK